MPAVYVLTFLTASATVFFEPCLLALVPEVVPRDRLLRANSILATGDNLTEIVGFAAAGALVAVLSTQSAFLIDSATFVVSAAAIGLIAGGSPDPVEGG